MKIIVGLGNPGKQYEGTRHNAGFMFVKLLAKEIGLDFADSKKFDSLVAEGQIGSEKILLVQPQTFMNLSGQAVVKIISYYKESAKKIIVVSDDVDMPLGQVRVRHEGSSGGHNGLQNIIDSLHNERFIRVRLGIQNPSQKVTSASLIDTKDYVLGKFDKREQPIITKTISEAVSFLLPFLSNSTEEIPAHTINIL